MNRALATLLALSAALVVGCGPKKDSCHLPSIQCGGKCVDTSSDPANCGGCGVTCGAGQTCCGSCVDLQADKRDCGACGHSCLGPGVADADASCSGGVCACAGGPTATECGGTCVNTTTDRAHCGDCTTACTFTGSQCEGGACGCFAPDPVECTSAVSSHPACTNLFDPQNCGTCGVSCTLPGKTACPAGDCACTSANLTNCGSAGCFDLQTDEAHCGACSGAGSSCTTGQLCCGASCKNVATDNANCGACGHACGAGQVCTAGTCVCSAGQIACGTLCCAGTACCGTGASSTCQTAHSNGLGQTFFDCNPAYTPGAGGSTTLQAATAAADAWNSGTTFPGLCTGSCIGRQTPTACAVWCFAPDPNAGQVSLGGFNCAGLCSNFPGATLTWK